jgi:hypothetical protein
MHSGPAGYDLARPLPLFPTGSERDGAPANGHGRDLDAVKPAHANGVTHGAAHGAEPKGSSVAGGNGVAGSNGTTNDHSHRPDRSPNGRNSPPAANVAPAAGDEAGDGLTPVTPPPVPRPRLLF